ncbi:hypothetical protein [Clostridium perfringens]|uniref:pyocin knob domain-containing protein n=1 Tax=Clostridium perfringens TaxID=1502 RepID=UPI0039EC4CA0
MGTYKTNWQLTETVMPEDMNRIEENTKENNNALSEFKKKYNTDSKEENKKIDRKAEKEDVILKVPYPEDRDCNSFKTLNAFCVFDTGIGDFKNTPEGTLAYGSAKVFVLTNRGYSDGRIQQEFVYVYPTERITRWVRNYASDNENPWGRWHKIYDEANKPTPQEIGALPTIGGELSGHLIMRQGQKFVGAHSYGYSCRTKEGTDDYVIYIDAENKVHVGYNGRPIKLDSIDIVNSRGRKVYHEDNKPTPADIGASSTNHTHDDRYMQNIKGEVLDFNDVKSPGTFTVGGKDIPNAPHIGSIYGSLLVMSKKGGEYNQLFINSTGLVYARFYNNQGYWTEWNKLYGGLNKPRPSEIGAATSDHNHDSKYFLVKRGSIDDFNLALTEGQYEFGSTESIPNAPVTGTRYGFLRVWVSNGGTHNNRDNWIWQEYCDTNGNNYWRFKVNNMGWNDWYKIYDSAHKPTPSDIGASPNNHNHDSTYLGKTATATNSNKLKNWDLAEGSTNFVGIPFIPHDGVMEVGRMIDFHESGTNKDFNTRLESINGALKCWQDFSAENLWARKYMRINDWYGGSEDGRLWFNGGNKKLYTENIEDLVVNNRSIAKGDYWDNDNGNVRVCHLGGGLRLVRQIIKTGYANSGGGVSYTIHFPKAWNWVLPISLISHNYGDASNNTSGYCTIDKWSNTYLNGGCYQMVAGKPTQIILTYIATE